MSEDMIRDSEEEMSGMPGEDNSPSLEESGPDRAAFPENGDPASEGEAAGRSTCEIEAAVEAILFATGRAVPSEDLARALGMERDEVHAAVAAMAERWNGEVRGTMIVELDGAWQMCTRKAYYPELITLELVPRKVRLTDVVLETLSVIAYKQPVTKAEIERIRGVNSDHAVNKLIEYHLVTELGRAKQPGRPILFGTTQEFLRVFGISSRDNLPEISPVQAADFREEAEREAGVTRSTEDSGHEEGPETGSADRDGQAGGQAAGDAAEEALLDRIDSERNDEEEIVGI